ncbi:MAG: NAD(P)/FAD-dependent oxidoreductase [Rhodospirillaceae bacterium]|nr:NAD(P)/FAD-dependent oxidoreductase [Rhodospirillaceae bacterium]
MTYPQHSTDVVVIGAGPVGLFSVFECGMAKLSCHVVDALEAIGGQCAALYPEKPIYDIPAHPAISGQDLIDRLAEQAAPFQPVYHQNQRVEALSRDDVTGRWLVTTSAGVTIDAGAVIIAAGSGAFGPNRPPLKRLSEFEGRSVFYMVRRRDDFRGKRVVIAGGGDSAVDWALSLADVADKVFVVHRRAKFRAAPDSEAKLAMLSAEGVVELVVPYQLKAIEGVDGQLSTVTVADLQGNTRDIAADVLLPFFGLAANLGPISDWGLDMDGAAIAIDPATAATSVPGIFAVGDIAMYPGKLKLILIGFAEAAAAAHAARAVIRPEEVVHFAYSTTQGVPIS